MAVPTEEYTYTPITESDKESVIRLFNYYILYSDAAFLETAINDEFFDHLKPLFEMYPSVSVRNKNGAMIGFGMVRPHNPMPAFQHTSVISYFVDPDYTGKGIGSQMLTILEDGARKKGVKIFLAEISSKNEGSIRFHERHGFTQQGRFLRVGIKNGSEFDTIWMQKFI